MANYTVFISYAHEDYEVVKRLYKDLIQAGTEAWLDKEKILPGQRWESVVRKAIESSRYFLAIISSNLVSKRGYVHREFKKGLEILEEFPESEIYLIPVRLDDSEPPYQKLKELHWVDLFPDWEGGVEKILLALKADRKVKNLSIEDESTRMISSSEDALTRMTLLNMKKLDEDIEHQVKYVNSLPYSPYSTSIDVESMKLKRTIDKRSQQFDTLRQIIDIYNQTAKGIIDSIES